MQVLLIALGQDNRSRVKTGEVEDLENGSTKAKILNKNRYVCRLLT